MDCIFCKIIKGEIPSKKAYEDDMIYAFHDVAPMAKTHILIVPKAFGAEHIENADGINEENSKYIARIFEKIPLIAKESGLSCENGLDNGYRIVSNCGKHARQSVFHLHFHLLGGEELSDKMV